MSLVAMVSLLSTKRKKRCIYPFLPHERQVISARVLTWQEWRKSDLLNNLTHNEDMSIVRIVNFYRPLPRVVEIHKGETRAAPAPIRRSDRNNTWSRHTGRNSAKWWINFSLLYLNANDFARLWKQFRSVASFIYMCVTKDGGKSFFYPLARGK